MFTNIIGTFFLLVIGIPLSIIGLIALFSAMILLLPDPIRQARENLEAHPWRSIFLGVLNFMGVGILTALVLSLGKYLTLGWQTPLLGLVAVLILLMAIPTTIGLSGMIMTVGVRIGERQKPFFTYLRGGGLLLLACLAPVIGWFVFTPIVIFASFGSVIGLLARPKKAKTAELPVEETTPIQN